MDPETTGIGAKSSTNGNTGSACEVDYIPTKVDTSEVDLIELKNWHF